MILVVAGVDEAGRGPLAGPVVAAACILPRGWSDSRINDSKQVDEEEVRTRIPSSGFGVWGLVIRRADTHAHADMRQIDCWNCAHISPAAAEGAVV